MGKRVTNINNIEPSQIAECSRSMRKRKGASNVIVTEKTPRLNNSSNYWIDNDEDSSSNDSNLQRHMSFGRHTSTKQANNSSILLNNLSALLDASVNESPKPVYTLRPSLVNGTILHDLTKKPWRLGSPIGKGNFGEIFLASDNINETVTNESAKFVVKIEPHSNGPLFVEIHCLMNTSRRNAVNDIKPDKAHICLRQGPPTGIPEYIASGSHYFGNARYRFLVLQRFDRDLHSLIKNCKVNQKHVLTLAIHIVTVLEKLHDKGYCHNDVKAQNVMISKCKYYKQKHDNEENIVNNNTIAKRYGSLFNVKYEKQEDEKQQTTDSGNSSEQDLHEEDEDTNFIIKRRTRKYDKYNDEDDEDFDDGSTSQSNNTNSGDMYETPITKNKKRRQRTTVVEYSGSNPVRSCRRRPQPNSIYEDMVKSHYLRPTKRISYSEFFSEDTSAKSDTSDDINQISSDDDSEEFLPQNISHTASKLKSIRNASARLTRQQEKQKQRAQNRTVPTLNSNTDKSSECTAIVEEERIFLIDFGLASKFMDNGVHRPFVMDQRRAHDGTLEFTSRDAHMGAHSRRSDLECLGYNLIFWSQGYLPWKDAASQHQQEKVHRAKEYLMTDVCEMLRQIYGPQVPNYLGEFLNYVGQLAYHERPDYARYRSLFEREYQRLGFSLEGMKLDGDEIKRTCVHFKEEIENENDIFEINKTNPLNIMKSLPMLSTPFNEGSVSNRVSPKNLRSKSNKKATKKKKFSWAEILSQDPDQIARERAEKEFDREEELSDIHHTTRRYEGRPTYAILEVQRRMKLNGRLTFSNSRRMGSETENTSNAYIFKQQSQIKNGDDADDRKQRTSHRHIDDDTRDKDYDVDGDDEDNDNDEIETSSDSDSDYMERTPQPKSRRRMTTRGLTTATKKRIYTPVANNKSTTTGRKKNYTSTEVTGVVVKAKQARTRSSGALTTTLRTSTANNNNTNIKRSHCRNISGALGRNITASAADEESSTISCPKHQKSNVDKNCFAINKPTERRTRRCLIKTDTEATNGGEDINSNFNPDIHGLFNVWKRINNESIYAKDNSNSNTSSAKHFKK